MQKRQKAAKTAIPEMQKKICVYKMFYKCWKYSSCDNNNNNNNNNNNRLTAFVPGQPG